MSQLNTICYYSYYWEINKVPIGSICIDQSNLLLIMPFFSPRLNKDTLKYSFIFLQEQSTFVKVVSVTTALNSKK